MNSLSAHSQIENNIFLTFDTSTSEIYMYTTFILTSPNLAAIFYFPPLRVSSPKIRHIFRFLPFSRSLDQMGKINAIIPSLFIR